MARERQVIINYNCPKSECDLELCKSLLALEGNIGTDLNITIIDTLKVLLTHDECIANIQINVKKL